MSEPPAKAVLVIDDDELISGMVARFLQASGYAVTCARGRSEILRTLTHRDFDLIITDVVMPELDGVEVVRLAREHQPNAVLIAMSGGGSYMSQQLCFQLTESQGVVAVLEKPLKLEHLIRTVEQAFANRPDQPETQN
jgi:CheY-like chemotaxis protein